MELPWHLWVDTGGTFTDCLARSPGGGIRQAKVLSSGRLRATLIGIGGDGDCRIGPAWPDFDGFLDGARIGPVGSPGKSRVVLSHQAGPGRVVVEGGMEAAGPGDPLEIDFGQEAPVVAARLVTRTPRGRPLPPMEMRLATTRATNALLEGSGGRVAFFVTRGFADLLPIGTQQRPRLFDLDIRRPKALARHVVEVDERIGADGRVLKPLDPGSLEEEAGRLLASGVDSAAIAFLHSWRNPRHERLLAERLRGMGFGHVSVSSALGSSIGFLPRAETAVVNAYLAPVMERYLETIREGLDGQPLQLMTSAGGLVPDRSFCPKDALLSGPAGGVVGAAMSGRELGRERIIGFDMGGTSADVSRYAGKFDYRFEHRVGPATLLAPSLRIETVAAGGGSICSQGLEGLAVGPESAGASPGPACYGAGGPLTLTDVNLLLGRMDPDLFGIPASLPAARAALRRLMESMEDPLRIGEEALLEGFLRIADQRMADAIRNISVREGYDPAGCTLVAFGGAGGQHACAIARILGISSILLPGRAGLLSAHGLRFAHLESFHRVPVLRPLEAVRPDLEAMAEEASRKAAGELERMGAPPGRTDRGRLLLHLRLEGQEASEEIEFSEGMDVEKAFLERYRRIFGYRPRGRRVELLSMVASARSRDQPPPSPRPAAAPGRPGRRPEGELRPPVGDPARKVPVHHRGAVREGESIAGPAIVQDGCSTAFVDPGWRAAGQRDGALLLEAAEPLREKRSGGEPDPIREEIQAHRFRHLVSEMGVRLERASVSTNVKDRRDFSCALLDPEGRLLANAPHIPVHLGAMGRCVRAVREALELAPGDMAVTNHPGYGGSHLPDITVISPVFDRSGTLLGHVANRAHHAELGGVLPGSMPPGARCLEEEGVVIAPRHLYRRGEARWEEMERILREARHPSRSPEDNLADLRAQAAAALEGSRALQQLALGEGTSSLLGIMERLRQRAAEAMERALRARPPLRRSLAETLDDGTPIAIAIELEEGRLAIDFAGTAASHPGSFNATPAIVHSVVLYVLRLLVDRPLPLNEGLLEPIDIRLPRCFLNPEFPGDPGQCPAVVAGNVETSQRIADALVRALGLAAGSQGTMNNLIFGNRRASYYETIGGGTGAGPGFDGAHGVHSHMTNTGITDPEILESRFPARLDRFALRTGSGGRGRRPGGDGLVRQLTFTEPVEVSLLSQRRREPPPGLEGGGPGRRGQQSVLDPDGSRRPLPHACSLSLEAGQSLLIETPGGGGWGS